LICLLCLYFACGTSTSPTEPKRESDKLTRPALVDSTLLRFENEITNFEKQDSTNGIDKGEILMIGSSSFRMWETMYKDLAPRKVLNRGFGGSTIPEVIHYADRIIFPYQPEKIVLYAGENDIAAGQSASQVFKSYKKFVSLVKEKLPNTKISFVSMKPSISRWHLWHEYKIGNDLIAAFCKTKPKLNYIDISEVMLIDNERIDSIIFIEDGLHMNALGYERWTKIIHPKLNE